VKTEYIAADTAQQNALVELKYTYLAAKARAAMHAAEVQKREEIGFFSTCNHDYDQT
jgi:hypothetical protein